MCKLSISRLLYYNISMRGLPFTWVAFQHEFTAGCLSVSDIIKLCDVWTDSLISVDQNKNIFAGNTLAK